MCHHKYYINRNHALSKHRGTSHLTLYDIVVTDSKLAKPESFFFRLKTATHNHHGERLVSSTTTGQLVSFG